MFQVTQGANIGGLSVTIRPAAGSLQAPAAAAERVPLRLSQPASGMGRDPGFVVQLAVYREAKAVPPIPPGLNDTTLYEVSFSVKGQAWRALRAGFFASEAQASTLRDALSKEFPDAFVAAVAADERAAAQPLERPTAGPLAGGSKQPAGETTIIPITLPKTFMPP